MRPKKTVAFATSVEYQNLSKDDLFGVSELARRGIEVVPLVWDVRPIAELTGIDALVLRSCWDYHK